MIRAALFVVLCAAGAGCVTASTVHRFDWEPRQLARRAPPLLLVHGLLAVGTRPFLGLTTFSRATIDALVADGFDVWLPALSAVAPPRVRAAELARAIDDVLARTGAAQVLIVAHSQAGVDVRLLLADATTAAKIAAVVTLSSPHAGTPLAELWRTFRGDAIESAINHMATAIARSRGWLDGDGQFRALGQALTPRAMRRLSTDHGGVPLFSVAADPASEDAADCHGDWPPPRHPGRLSVFMWLGGQWLDELVGHHVPNDGVVPVASQRCGHFLGCVPVDHAAWLHPSRGGVDVTAVIVELARGLRDVAGQHDERAMAAHVAALAALVR